MNSLYKYKKRIWIVRQRSVRHQCQAKSVESLVFSSCLPSSQAFSYMHVPTGKKILSGLVVASSAWLAALFRTDFLLNSLHSAFPDQDSTSTIILQLAVTNKEPEFLIKSTWMSSIQACMSRTTSRKPNGYQNKSYAKITHIYHFIWVRYPLSIYTFFSDLAKSRHAIAMCNTSAPWLRSPQMLRQALLRLPDYRPWQRALSMNFCNQPTIHLCLSDFDRRVNLRNSIDKTNLRFW